MRSAKLRVISVSVGTTPAALSPSEDVVSSTIMLVNNGLETISFGDENYQGLSLAPNGTFSLDDVFPHEAEAYFNLKDIWASAGSATGIDVIWVEIDS